jgi:hypothetical protein
MEPNLLYVRGVKHTVTGEDISQEIEKLMSKYHLSLNKLHGVSTDRACEMVGSKIGLVTKIRAKLNSMNLDENQLCVTLHNPPAEFMCQVNKVTHVISEVVTCINFIK